MNFKFTDEVVEISFKHPNLCGKLIYVVEDLIEKCKYGVNFDKFLIDVSLRN